MELRTLTPFVWASGTSFCFNAIIMRNIIPCTAYLWRKTNKTSSFVYVETSSLPSHDDGSGCDSRQQCDDLEKMYPDTLIFEAAIERQTRGGKQRRAEAEPCGKNLPNLRILAKVWGTHRDSDRISGILKPEQPVVSEQDC